MGATAEPPGDDSSLKRRNFLSVFQAREYTTTEHESIPLSSADSQKKLKLSHLEHLNGLRAVAFIGVLLYHFQYSCPGGFLGVDIFFVLSGYLMTRSIQFQLDQQTFSIVSFMRKRFFRLYPCLLFVILLTLAMAYGLFAPELATEVARSALAAVSAVSNWFFMGQQGYFDTASTVKPFLHTWSLSVEWQFYLLWPLVLAFWQKFQPQHRITWLFLSLGTASFVHGVRITETAPQAAFFLLPGRVFEFAVGALITCWAPGSLSDVAGSLLSITGTGLIVASFLSLDSSFGAPAVVALPAVIGAAMIIASPSHVAGNRMYRNVVLDYIGKISYSAYLVHWPVYVFYNNVFEHVSVPFSTDLLVVLGLMLFSAWMYHNVENKFRTGYRWQHRLATTLLLVVVCLVSWSCTYSSGWKARIPSRSRLSIAVKSSRAMRTEFDVIYDPHEQSLGPGHGKATFGTIPPWGVKSVEAGDAFDAVVVGDSFAAPLTGVLKSIALAKNKSFVLMSHYSCPPFFDVRSMDPKLTDYNNPKNNPRANECKGIVRAEMMRFVKAVKSNIIVLMGDWARSPQMNRATQRLAKGDTQKNERATEFEESLQALLSIGKRVIVIGVIPGSNYNVRECFAATGPLSFLKKCPLEAKMSGKVLREHKEVRTVFEKLMKSSDFFLRARQSNKLTVIDPWEVMCNEQKETCVVARPREPLYYDKTHISMNASLLLQPLLEAALRQVESATG